MINCYMRSCAALRPFRRRLLAALPCEALARHLLIEQRERYLRRVSSPLNYSLHFCPGLCIQREKGRSPISAPSNVHLTSVINRLRHGIDAATLANMDFSLIPLS